MADFVVAMIKGGSGSFAIKAGDAQSRSLKKMYDGPRPKHCKQMAKAQNAQSNRRLIKAADSLRTDDPMKKQGAIILGIGGDNSDSAIGTFYEGVMTSGYSTDAADNALQANIASVGYGKSRVL